MRTYISLFSSAGVGCYGFKMEGFQCIATNELLERRLNIQKINKKCKYDSGYINGDITLDETKKKIMKEISLWEKKENIDKVDVIMATPPCQGMSTANYKKGDEINRNSLVVEAIHLVNNIEPRIFVFENVRAFLNTMCIDKDEEMLGIKECIYKNLGHKYNIYHKVINFMDYGVPSSRPRTIVIGTLKSELNITPLNLFPLKRKRITVRDAIGDLQSLQYGQRDENDLYHSFRVYPSYMQEWIHELKEGETAFNNSSDKVPYKIVDGKRQILKSGHMGNKFCRMFWDNPAPCITTRNDQLASQSTIHPSDDRVLSIRELMRVMTIPDSFCWVDKETKTNIDKSETLIRQSIGEAVPTEIIRTIAYNIKQMLDFDDFIKEHPKGVELSKFKRTNNFYIDSFVFEKNLDSAKETGSFYTPQVVVYNTIKNFSATNQHLRILEPAVGLGAFIPQFLRLVDDCDCVEFDLFDVSEGCLNTLKALFEQMRFDEKFRFNYINYDFISYCFDVKYDAIISNPPYFKMKASQKKEYSKLGLSKSDNIYCLFLDKFRSLSNEIMCVIPKTFLMIPDCNDVRNSYQNEYYPSSIFDYGVKYFKEVFVEILSIHFKKKDIDNCMTHIENMLEGIIRDVPSEYIFHDKMWLLYRDEWFDRYIKKMQLDVFDFYRDRQLTNKYLTNNKEKYWVIKSKNVLDDGTIIHKDGYDKYVDNLDNFILKKYINKKYIIFTNFTYNTRASVLPDNCVVNGSLCIFFPKKDVDLDLSLYSTSEFRKYYAIVKNLSKFTINVDSNSIYYIGVMKNV